MSRTDEFWGSGNIDHLFNGNPITTAPFPSARRRKADKDYDEGIVKRVFTHPEEHPTVQIDPRTLSATQPMVTRAGVSHYSNPDNAGKLYADQHNVGNARPVVYEREGEHLLLSGTHRATAALLAGRQFDAVKVSGPWGPPRNTP